MRLMAEFGEALLNLGKLLDRFGAKLPLNLSSSSAARSLASLKARKTPFADLRAAARRRAGRFDVAEPCRGQAMGLIPWPILFCS
jgi:hypothetical protein